MKECPVCEAKVKPETLTRHVERLHPRAGIEARSLLTKSERAKMRERRPAARPQITRGGRRFVFVIAVLIFIVLLIVIVWPLLPKTGTAVGSVAPDFTLDAADGGRITLSGLRGQPIFLEFMDVDCGACKEAAENVIPFVYQNYSSQVTFLGVDVNFIGEADTNAKIDAYMTTYGLSFPHPLDVASVTSAYGVDRTPTTFILDRNGVVVRKFIGVTGVADYASALAEALAR